MSEVDELVEKSKREGFLLCKTSRAKAAPGCYLGGLPTLPERYEWPHSNAVEIPPVPLHFVGQIDLAAVPEGDNLPEAPRQGTLFFFVDPIFGSSFEFRGGTAAVIYCEDDLTNVPDRPMPEVDFAALPQDGMNRDYRKNPKASPFQRWDVLFEPRVSYDANFFLDPDFGDPDAEEKAIDLGLEEKSRLKKMLSVRSPHTDKALHSMFAGPDSMGRLIAGSVSYETDLIPLVSLKPDSSLVWVHPHEWVVFWITPDDLKNSKFSEVYVSEGRG